MPSTVIRSFDYDAAHRRLHIVFVTGRHYNYEDVPQDVVGAMRAAPSRGRFFNEHVRDAYAFAKDPA